MLGPLFLALGTDISTNREPGSAVFLELFEEDNLMLQPQAFARLTYKQTASDSWVFRLPGVPTRPDGAMAVADFRAFIDGKLRRWNEELGFRNNDVAHCSDSYTAGEALGTGAA